MTGAKAPPPLPRPPAAVRGLLLVALSLFWAWILLSPAMGEALHRGVALLLGLASFTLGLRYRGAPPRVEALLSRLEGLELWRGRGLLLLALVYVLPRLPLLVDPSYGADPDAWRVALSGSRLWSDHVYEASRLPGYPLTEIGLSPLVVLGGPVAAKLGVAAAGLLGLALFARLGRALGGGAVNLATLALALAPLHVVSSASALDHVPALTALLGALLLLQAGRDFWGGAAVGFAAGFRPSTAAFLLPAVLGRRAAGARWRDLGLLALTAAEAGALAFIPVFAAYRSAFVPESTPEGDALLSSGAALGAIGLIPTLVLGFPLGEAVRRWREPGLEPAVAWLLGGLVLVGLGLFVGLPLQSGYLLPALGWGLLLLGLLGRREALGALILASLLALPLETIPGSLRGEAATRRSQIAAYEEIRAAKVEDHAVILLGGGQYALAANLGVDLRRVAERGVWERALREPSRDLLYVARLPERAWTRAGEEGRPIYVWNPFVDAWTKENYGYSPLERGARLLRGELAEPTASASAATAERRWNVSPRKAAERVRTEGSMVRIDGWSGEPIRACADPSTPANEAARLLGEVRLKGGTRQGDALRVYVTWEGLGGDRLANNTILSLSEPDAPVTLNERLRPPEGAARARLCARLDGADLVAVLDNLRLAP